MYGDMVINAIYTAANGGRTVSSLEQWGSPWPFLIEQDDPWDKAAGYKKSGTGVGMSQRGAMYAAKQGVGYKEILAFYYPGTFI
jgi:peptidoglycan hydrolase-like amidase